MGKLTQIRENNKYEDMTFFARPNLDNTQFKQLKGGEPLTLSGQTQIATVSGLTLTDGAGGYIPVVATGATNNYVLTYDSSDQAIKLKESSASGGSSVYTYTGDTTCAVGGLDVGQNLFNDSLVDIIHCMVSPTLPPTLSLPTISSFTIAPSNLLYEIGTEISIVGTTNFNGGSISPVYPPTACSCRSNGVCCYVYSDFGPPATVSGPALSDVYNFTSAYSVGVNSNTVSVNICYCCGVQPYDSAGDPSGTPLVSGATGVATKNIIGTYPWFWGTSVGAPTIGQALIDNYTTKCIQSNYNSIIVDNFNVSGEYIWFAIPAGNTRTSWQGANNPSNSGVIPGILFPSPTTMNIDSPDVSGCWGGLHSYEIYVSNSPTSINYGMTFSN